MIIELLRYIRGYVGFEIIGEYPERLLNQLAANGISAWGISRRKSKLKAFVSVGDYFKIRSCRRRNRVRTQVTERHGLPFSVKRHRLRIGFAVGAVCYITALMILSGFIWNVGIVGNQSITDSEIKQICSELGLKEGVRRSNIDVGRLKSRLALKIDKAAWVSVNIEGVKATVNISEITSEKEPQKEPCNLVAQRDGIITAVEATSGSISVKVGQTVKKGELLVSGVTEFKDGTYRFGTAEGKITAETEREISCFVPFSHTELVRSGQSVKRSAISFFGVDIPLYLGSVKGLYETEKTVFRYENAEAYLPIKLTSTVFYELEEVTVELSYEQAEAAALEKLENIKATELENVEILSETKEIDALSDGIRVTARLKCRENIAKSDFILILSEK